MTAATGQEKRKHNPQKRAFVWLFVLLGTLGAVLATAEIAARLVVIRISRVESRTVREYEGIYNPPPRLPLMLFLGNSLLEAAINFPAFRQSIFPRADVRRYFVDNTTYYDWYFGIRRILAEGARPRVIALMLSDLQFTASSIRGGYSALRLFRTADIPEVAERLDLHPTETAGLITENLSTFYGLRAEIRKVVLGRLMPDLPGLTALILNQRGRALDDAAFYRLAQERMRALRALVESNGSRLVLLPPPLPHDDSARLVRVALREGVTVVRPFTRDEFDTVHFRDGFHLNQEGQAIYTSQLVRELERCLVELVQ